MRNALFVNALGRIEERKMSFTDVLKKSIVEGFTNTDIPTIQIVLTLGITFLIAMYIYISLGTSYVVQTFSKLFNLKYTNRISPLFCILIVLRSIIFRIIY